MNDRGNIVIYQTKDGKTSIDVKLEDETVWLTQAQMAELFQKDRTVIGRHINNVYRNVPTSISGSNWKKPNWLISLGIK